MTFRQSAGAILAAVSALAGSAQADITNGLVHYWPFNNGRSWM